jgi:hypothetical protein
VNRVEDWMTLGVVIFVLGVMAWTITECSRVPC